MAEADALKLSEIYRPKFPLTRNSRIFTAGSCFAQHLSLALRHAGCAVIDTEPAPPRTPDHIARRFGYGLYAARFGNIYTIRHLRQLIEEAAGEFTPANPIWQRDGRYYDAQRPGVEPDGLATADAVHDMRDMHLAAIAQALMEAEVLVFTLGLTEAWEHRDSGTIYPTAPGTIAGSFNADDYVLRNFGFEAVVEDFRVIKHYLTQLNPAMKFLLTVSPVPLTATAGGNHVLAASTYSKSVLRAAAGALTAEDSAVDYFPAYEIVTNPALAGRAFSDNMRNVRPEVVDAVIGCFFAAHGLAGATPRQSEATGVDEDCEDVLLEAFAS